MMYPFGGYIISLVYDYTYLHLLYKLPLFPFLPLIPLHIPPDVCTLPDTNHTSTLKGVSCNLYNITQPRAVICYMGA